MAISRKTIIWILVAIVGLGVVCIVGVAGAGMYFVSKHVHAGPSTSADAFRAFDAARARFKDEKPVFDMDNRERPRQVRQFDAMPTSPTKTDVVWVLAWDPDHERLVRVSMPFWLLRLGRQKIDISGGGFDFQRMELDINELQRVGPVLLFDFRTPDGKRVLVWTQ